MTSKSTDAIALPRPRCWKELTGGQQKALRRAMEYIIRYLNSRSSSRQFYNIITIEGGRGTGKTTLLETLLFFLRCLDYRRLSSLSNNNEYYDIAKSLYEHFSDLLSDDGFPALYILDPVDPDLFNGGKAQTILTWIFQNIQKLQEQESNKTTRLPECGLHRTSEELVRKIEMLDRNRGDLNKNLAIVAGDYLSHAIHLSMTRWDYTNEINEAQRSSWQLKQCIDDYLESFAEYISALHNEKSNKYRSGKEVLIVVPIDDVDLAGRRAADLLQMVSNYLNNPNLLVIMMGDRGAFQDALMEKLFIDLPKNLAQDPDFRERQAELTCNILEKALLPEAAVRIEETIGSYYEQFVAEAIEQCDELAKMFIYGSLEVFDDAVPDGNSLDSDADSSPNHIYTAYIGLFRSNIRHVKSLAHAFSEYCEHKAGGGDIDNPSLVRPLLDLLVTRCAVSGHGTSDKYILIDDATGHVEINVSGMARNVEAASPDDVISFCFLHDLLIDEPISRVWWLTLDRERVAVAFNKRFPVAWLEPRHLPPVRRFIEADLLLLNAYSLFHQLVVDLAVQLSAKQKKPALDVDIFLLSEEGGNDPVGAFLVKACLFASFLMLGQGYSKTRKPKDVTALFTKALGPRSINKAKKKQGVERYWLDMIFSLLNAEKSHRSYGYHATLRPAHSYIKKVIDSFRKVFVFDDVVKDKEEKLSQWLDGARHGVVIRTEEWQLISTAIYRGFIRWDEDREMLELTAAGELFIRGKKQRK